MPPISDLALTDNSPVNGGAFIQSVPIGRDFIYNGAGAADTGHAGGHAPETDPIAPLPEAAAGKQPARPETARAHLSSPGPVNTLSQAGEKFNPGGGGNRYAFESWSTQLGRSRGAKFPFARGPRRPGDPAKLVAGPAGRPDTRISRKCSEAALQRRESALILEAGHRKKP